MAEEIVRRVRALLPLPDDGSGAAAAAAQQQGRFDEALALAEAGLAKDPTRAFWWVVQGDALAGLGRLDRAGAAFEEAVGLASDAQDDRMFLALVLYTNQPEVAASAAVAGLRWARMAAMLSEAARQPKSGGVREAWKPSRKPKT